MPSCLKHSPLSAAQTQRRAHCHSAGSVPWLGLRPGQQEGGQEAAAKCAVLKRPEKNIGAVTRPNRLPWAQMECSNPGECSTGEVCRALPCRYLCCGVHQREICPLPSLQAYGKSMTTTLHSCRARTAQRTPAPLCGVLRHSRALSWRFACGQVSLTLPIETQDEASLGGGIRCCVERPN